MLLKEYDVFADFNRYLKFLLRLLLKNQLLLKALLKVVVKGKRI